ncbi:MAG: sigma 54-interacting transcriptional regulator [Pseudomonadota bacterium]
MTKPTPGLGPENIRRPRLLTLAALFQGDFSIDWLQALEPAKASDILLALEEGVGQGLIVRRGTGVYAFGPDEERRRLLDDVPPAERSRLRGRIAEIVLAEVPDEPERIKAAAGQLLHATNGEEGCRLLLRAGDIFRRDYQPASALWCYEKIFADLKDRADRNSNWLFGEAAIGYSKVTASAHEAKSVLDRLREAAARTGPGTDKVQQALLEMHLAKNEWLRNNYETALEHFERGRAAAGEVDDPRLKRSVNVFSTFFPYWHGRFAEAVRNYEQLVPDVAPYPRGRFPLLAGATIGTCYALTGQVSQGLGMLHAVHSLCRDKGDRQIAGVAQNGLGWIFMEMNRLDEAISQLEEACGRKKEMLGILHEAGLLQLLAYCHYRAGNNRRAAAYHRDLARLGAAKDINVMTGPPQLELCWAAAQGRFPRAAGLDLEKMIAQSLTSRNVWVRGTAFRYQALLLLREGRPAGEATGALRASVALLEESGHRMELARTRLELARHFLNQGREEEARDEAARAAETLLPLDRSLIPEDLRPLVKTRPARENLLDEMLELGQEVVTIRDSKALVQAIISAVNRITGAERGAIFLWEDPGTGPELVLRAARDLAVEDLADPDFAPSMELIRQTAVSGRGRIRDFSDDPTRAAASGRDIRSCVCVPMKLGGRVVGALYHDNRFLPSVFLEPDLKMLSFFAAQAAMALANAAAHEETRDLNEALRKEKQYIEEQRLENPRYEEIIGKSPAILKTLELAGRVAGTEAAVLILGETGVGKEIVARAIHRNSPRADKPFIKVNCAALPETLISSELFGHEKGAFTGAAARRPGRFELAHGGTIFLDEIGEIPLNLQATLLRVLQSKEFERVGGRETLRSDFRLVAATNRDLGRAVKNQKFRQDLYYRLNVFPLNVPPLRERKEDLPLLARHFLRIHSARAGKAMDSIPDRELEKLMRYDWPGNVRELENIIERGVLLGVDRFFRTPELDLAGGEGFSSGEILTLEENERRMILKALDRTGGRIRGRGGAAELLGLHRNTLYSRMKKLGLRTGGK